MSSNPTGLGTVQPQTLFRFSKPEARPYVVVAQDPDHGDFGPFTPGTQTAGLQEAINFVASLGGGTVFVKRGRYVTPYLASLTYVYIPSNVRVVGEGVDAAVLNMPVALGSPILGSSAPLTKNASLEDLTIDGTGFPNNFNGIFYRYVENAHIRRIKVFNVPFWSIVGAFESGVPTSPSLYIEDCVFDRNGNSSGQQDMSAFNFNNYVLLRNTVWKNNPYGSTCLLYQGQNVVEVDGLRLENNKGAVVGLNVGTGSTTTARVRGVTSDGSAPDYLSPTYLTLTGYNSPGTLIMAATPGTATPTTLWAQLTAATAGIMALQLASGGVATMAQIDAGQLQFFPTNGATTTFIGAGLNVRAALAPNVPGVQPGVLGSPVIGISSPTTVRLMLSDVLADGGINLADNAPSSNLITYVGSITNPRIVGNNAGGGLGNGNLTLGQILGSPTEPFNIEGGFVYSSIVYASPNQIVNHKIRGIGPYVEPNIPVNPPVSGTTYQNVNPFGIVLLVPVALTPTANAAASATISVGASPNTLSTVQTISAAAGTSPTGGVLQAAVPQGQYFEITLTNATAYQAIVLPE